MSTLSNLAPKDDIQEREDEELLRGGLSYLWETGIYDVIIDTAYLTKTDKGSLHLNLEVKAIGKEFEGKLGNLRSRLLLQGTDANGNKNYYGEKKTYFDSFVISNHIHQIVKGTTIDNATTQEKVLEIYDFNARGKVPTKVEVLTSLLGKKPFKLGVHKIRKNKKILQAGNWTDKNEETIRNEIHISFTKSGKTVLESKNKSGPNFIEKWKEKYGTEMIDNYRVVGSKGDKSSDALSDITEESETGSNEILFD